MERSWGTVKGIAEEPVSIGSEGAMKEAYSGRTHS